MVTIDTQVRDAAAAAAACRRLGLPEPIPNKTVQLFSQQTTGLAVQLPGWRYPLVCDLAQGRLHFDNFDGRWGDPGELNRFLQAYAVEKTRSEARQRGCVVVERAQADGSIRLSISIQGGAA